MRRPPNRGISNSTVPALFLCQNILSNRSWGTAAHLISYMKQEERASIARIVADLIKADAIIDTREIDLFMSIRNKYAIKSEDEIKAESLTLADAVKILSASSESLKNDLMGDFLRISMSDDFCAREEALIILALQACLTEQFNSESFMVSVEASNLSVESSQMIYIESEYCDKMNSQISKFYREISSEARLAGFDFVYLPKLSEHYLSISENSLLQITQFLYPKASEDLCKTVIHKLRNLSTSEFCKDQLSAKLGIKELSDTPPAFLFLIGNSTLHNKIFFNFLLIELEDDVLGSIRNIFDYFSKYYHTHRLNYLKEEKGRFVYAGFRKQVFDLYMLRKGVKSSVVIDIYRNRIVFPEADVILENLHRREKALYALFLLESSSGGINFNKPDSPKALEKYNKRMLAVQNKYNKIYRMFGGDLDKAPTLHVSEIRLPMISLIKKQISKLNNILFHSEDYVIQRNIYGNYCVNISPDLCCQCGENRNDVTPMHESEVWRKISAL